VLQRELVHQSAEAARSLEQHSAAHRLELSALTDLFSSQVSASNAQASDARVAASSAESICEYRTYEAARAATDAASEKRRLGEIIEKATSQLTETRVLLQDRELEVRARDSAVATELARLASQAAATDSDASRRVAESRDEFLACAAERLELAWNAARSAREDARAACEAASHHSTAHADQFANLIDCFHLLHESCQDSIRLSEADSDSVAGILSLVSSQSEAVLSRAQQERAQLEAAQDALFARLASSDRAAAARAEKLLARALPLLQRLSTSFLQRDGGAASAAGAEVAALRALCEKLRPIIEGGVGGVEGFLPDPAGMTDVAAKRARFDAREAHFLGEARRLRAAIEEVRARAVKAGASRAEVLGGVGSSKDFAVSASQLPVSIAVAAIDLNSSESEC
jgi:hypothetical protein